MDGSLTPYAIGMREFIGDHINNEAAGNKRKRGGRTQSLRQKERPKWAEEMGLVSATTSGYKPYTSPMTASAMSNTSDLASLAYSNSNASLHMTERKYNAYPGERQAWTNLELLMVFSEAGGLREKEYRDIMELSRYPVNGRAKYEIVRREALRHAFGGLY